MPTSDGHVPLNERAEHLGPEGGVRWSPCVRCKHKRGPNICAAFPTGIPWAIVSGENRHTRFFPGDNGIRFEQVTPEDLRPVHTVR